MNHSVSLPCLVNFVIQFTCTPCKLKLWATFLYLLRTVIKLSRNLTIKTFEQHSSRRYLEPYWYRRFYIQIEQPIKIFHCSHLYDTLDHCTSHENYFLPGEKNECIAISTTSSSCSGRRIIAVDAEWYLFVSSLRHSNRKSYDTPTRHKAFDLPPSMWSVLLHNKPASKIFLCPVIMPWRVSYVKFVFL